MGSGNSKQTSSKNLVEQKKPIVYKDQMAALALTAERSDLNSREAEKIMPGIKMISRKMFKKILKITSKTMKTASTKTSNTPQIKISLARKIINNLKISTAPTKAESASKTPPTKSECPRKSRNLSSNPTSPKISKNQ